MCIRDRVWFRTNARRTAMANGVTVTQRWIYANELSYGPYAENSWHASYNPLVSDAEQCAESLKAGIVAFWAQSAVHEDSLSLWLADSLDSTAQFSWVDWEDSTNTSIPMSDEGFNLGVGQNLPNECA